MKKNYFFLLLLFWTLPSFSQIQEEMCGSTMDFHSLRMENDPNYRNHVRKHRTLIEEVLSNENRDPSCTNGPIIIPVAVHFDNGVVPSGQEACAIQIVEDHIDALNNDLIGQNVDAGLFTPFETCFGTTVGDACIELCLANINHPTGYGLIEGESAITFGEVNFSIKASPGSNVPKDVNWAGYLNIYVDDLFGGLQGQAAGIPGDFSGEGVVIDECILGTGMEVTCPGMNSSAACGGALDEGEVLTHEIGHYLGLYHVWGDGGCGQDDMISDTPAMSNNYSLYSSCGSHTQCSQLPSGCGSEDMYMNFMSYASNACMYMFTSDQADVMYTTAVDAGFSNISPDVCDATPVPVIIYSTGDICEFGCLAIGDASSNNPDTWNWTFTVTSGDILLDTYSSTDRNVDVCIIGGTSGVIEAFLVVSNSFGPSELTESISINVDNTCTLGCFPVINLDLENDNFLTYTNASGGFITGSNSNNHASKAELFDLASQGICYPSEITNLAYTFGGQSGSPAGTIDLVIWDNTGIDGNGNVGAPGSVIYTSTINLVDLLPNIISRATNYIDFTTAPITVNTPFYIGFTGFNSTLTGGDIGIMSNSDTETSPATAWEEWDDGAWYPMDDPSSWGLEIALYIGIDILPEAPSPSFTTASGAICDDGTSYTFTNTTPDLCSGGTADYIWTLKDANGLEISTSTNTDFMASFSSTGTYELELCAYGPACEYDCQTTSLQVLTCGNCNYTMLSHPELPLNETGVADYESGDWIISEAVIMNGASVDYDAIEYVQLNPGFTVEQGGVFTAFIDGCNSGGGGNNFNGLPNTSLETDSDKVDEMKQSDSESNDIGERYIKTLRSIILQQIEPYLK